MMIVETQDSNAADTQETAVVSENQIKDPIDSKTRDQWAEQLDGAHADWDRQTETAKEEWKKQDRENMNESKLDAERREVEQSSTRAKLAAMTPVENPDREELFVVVANEQKALCYTLEENVLYVDAQALPMNAFPGQESLALPKAEGEPSSSTTVVEVDTQIKYLNNRNSIHLTPAEKNADMISIENLEKRLASLEDSGEVVSAEYLAAVYRLKLEQQRKEIEAAIEENGAPDINLDIIPGSLKTESDKQWIRRDPEDGELRGDEWLWVEERGGKDVVMFKNEESLSVIWDKNSQKFIFNIEAAPAQAYQQAIILNGGADENKIAKKLTVTKEAAEEHSLKVQQIVGLGKVVANPDRLRGASNMHIAIAEFNSTVRETEGQGADEITEILPEAFSQEEVKWLILTGKITDARTIAGFYLAELYLQDHQSFLSED